MVQGENTDAINKLTCPHVFLYFHNFSIFPKHLPSPAAGVSDTSCLQLLFGWHTIHLENVDRCRGCRDSGDATDHPRSSGFNRSHADHDNIGVRHWFSHFLHLAPWSNVKCYHFLVVSRSSGLNGGILKKLHVHATCNIHQYPMMSHDVDPTDLILRHVILGPWPGTAYRSPGRMDCPKWALIGAMAVRPCRMFFIL